jgi:mRNA interferase MazF
VKLPQRGEVWLVDLGLAAKVRPAVVMSIPAADVDRALVTVVPHTTSARGSRFEAAVSVPFLSQLATVERAMAIWLGLSLAAGSTG